ncbi:MPN domain-containing protein isoform X3 [Hydra vulgaris]|uniref:MPN domain-containing protein isoform X3 n=1 Tax=Hydra vulgaris TaxID=6087 RepID=A0ABM4C0B4_HYDVU
MQFTSVQNRKMQNQTYSDSLSDTENSTTNDEDDASDDEDVDNKQSSTFKPADLKPQEVFVAPKDSPMKDSPTKKKVLSKSAMLTGRGVTTQMLIEENILEAGENNLTINYLGNKFVGDLKEDGTINCKNANRIFSSPSAWAMHCKKQVNPDKKSGCGWASVKYKGRKLDEFKSTWFRKQKIEQAVAASTIDAGNSTPYAHQRAEIDEFITDPTPSEKNKLKKYSASSLDDPIKSSYVPPTTNYLTFSEALKVVHAGQANSLKVANAGQAKVSKFPDKPTYQIKSNNPSIQLTGQKGIRKRIARTKTSVKHSSLTSTSDTTTLVECAQFQSIGRIQPFSVSICTSALLLMDFHCHLSLSEVSGYIAGEWNISRQHVRVTDVYPCHYSSSSNSDEIEKVELKIRDTIKLKGLVLLGWYHSHPFFQPDPSISDINSQLEYQKILKDGHYEPCFGIIISPFESYKKESQFNAFWVREPSENSSNQYGLPLSVCFTTHQDKTLSQNIINEMVALVNYYQNSDESVKLTEVWSADVTYLEKLKHSIIRKFPQDQTDGRFLDFVHKMTVAALS